MLFKKTTINEDVREDKMARLVFNNHTVRLYWTVVRKEDGEAFVASLGIRGFLRENELSRFLSWVSKEMPEFQGNLKHKKEHDWNLDSVEVWGGQYHTGWKVRVSDLTPSGEFYHRVLYLHSTGSGKLSWSYFWDPMDFIIVLDLLRKGRLTSPSTKDGVWDLNDDTDSDDMSWDPRETETPAPAEETKAEEDEESEADSAEEEGPAVEEEAPAGESAPQEEDAPAEEVAAVV